MRPLTEEETKVFFQKLSEYIGKSIERLINRSDERYCFRMIKDRVYYVSETVMKSAASVSRDSILHMGTCFGKFSKSGKFRLHITALEYLAQFAVHKVWVKSNAEMSFLYGNNVIKKTFVIKENNLVYLNFMIDAYLTQSYLSLTHIVIIILLFKRFILKYYIM